MNIVKSSQSLNFSFQILPFTQRLVNLCLLFLLGLGFTGALSRIFPQTRFQHIPWLMIGIALVALLTHTRTRSMDTSERNAFRISEGITYLVVLKVISMIISGQTNLVEAFHRWQVQFLESIFDLPYITSLLPGMVAWGYTLIFADLYDEFEDRRQDFRWDELGKVQNSLKAIRSKMVGGNVALLVALVFLLAFANTPIDIPNVVSLPLTVKSSAAIVILFTAFLLIQLAITQLSLLRTYWEHDRSQIDVSINRKWLMYSLVVMGVAGVISLFLPTDYSRQFFTLFLWFSSILFSFFSLLLYLLSYPFLLLFHFLFAQDESSPSLPGLPAIQPPVTAAEPGPLPLWFEIAKTIILWGIILGIIFIAGKRFFSTTSTLFPKINRKVLFQKMRDFFKALFHFLFGVKILIQEQIAQLKLQSKPRQLSSKPSFRPLRSRRAHNAREKILNLYCDLVDFAGDHGLQRLRNQTPYQYRSFLSSALPDLSSEIIDITEIFIEARYSLHPLDENTASRIASETLLVKKAIKHNAEESPFNSIPRSS